jgi:hypothetical protein
MAATLGSRPMRQTFDRLVHAKLDYVAGRD